MRVSLRHQRLKWHRPVSESSAKHSVSLWPGVAIGVALAGLYWWGKHRGTTESSYASVEDFEALCLLHTVTTQRLSQMSLAATRYNHCYDVPLSVTVTGTRRADGKHCTVRLHSMVGQTDMRALDHDAYKRNKERMQWANREYHTWASMGYFLDVVDEYPREHRPPIWTDDWRSVQRQWHQSIESQFDTAQAIDITVKYRARWLPDFFAVFE